MAIYILIALILTHIGLPLLILYDTIFVKSKSKFELLLKSLTNLSFIIFLYFVGRWDYISLHLRSVTLIFFSIILVFKVLKNWNRVPLKASGSQIRFFLKNSFALVLFLGFIFEILKGLHCPDAYINLSMPLKNAYVAQGGNSILLNYHFPSRSQRFALDLTALNSQGRKSSKLFPNSLQDFEIYGDTILSPCDCKIEKIATGMEDTPLGEKFSGIAAGNHIVLNYKNNLVIIAHILKNSFLIKEGEIVKKGDAIARVGNSGNSSEPH